MTAKKKGRGLTLAGMGAGIAGSYLGYLAQRAFLGEEQRGAKKKAASANAARRMKDDLQALRGPAMKLGQMLSIQSGLLPEEALDELSSLQMQAPAMHPSLVRAQFKASMGRYPDEVFREFDPEPFACASLGQVHRAVTHEGDAVAVKVQYPGMRDAVAHDLKLLRNVMLPARATGHITATVLDEVQAGILAETDYRQEAENAEFFAKALAPLSFVSVPRIYREYSSDRVLTMSLVPGESLDRFLARKPSQRTRDLVGARLVELLYFQFLRVGAFHADPHWGNYLFRADGTLGLIDFGCVKRLRPEFVAHLREIYLYPGDRTGEAFKRMLRERYAIFGRKVTPAVIQAFTSAAENFYRRVYPPEPSADAQPFDFSDAAIFKSLMRESRGIIAAKGVLPEYIFYGRAETGLYSTLHRLGARVAMSGIVRKYLDA